jgi:alkylhydroperoxidase family enzyme
MRELPEPLRHTTIGRILSHAPTLIVPYYASYAALLDGLELDAGLRQLAILRVAARAESAYIRAQHTALAQLVGVSDEQIDAAREPVIDAACLGPIEQLVLAVVDEVIDAPRISDSLFQRLCASLSPRETVELLLVIGWYWTACRLTTALDVEPETALGHQALAMARDGRAHDRGSLRVTLPETEAHS